MNQGLFLQNGVLVITIKHELYKVYHKIRFSYFRSIRFLIFSALFSIGLLSIVAMSIIFISSTNERYVTEKKEELYRQGNTIAISLVTTGFFSPEKDKSYLATIQASVRGRGLVLDQHGVVLFDSNHLDSGKLYSSAQVRNALKGRSSYQYLSDANMAMVTVPIMSEDFESVIGAVIVADSFKDIRKSVNQMINLTLIIGLILLIIDFVIAYFLSSVFNRPFLKLINHINRVRDGHVDEKVEIKSNREIEEISKAFNLMTSRLSAIESNRKQFVANVSHELKTPLSSVKVLAESLILQPDAPVEIYQEFLTDINKEIDRETKIINDLLMLVTLDKKDSPVEIAEININQLIQNVINRLRPLADQAGVSIYFNQNRTVVAEVDETKLELVFTNLIQNAIKYNQRQGKINIGIDTDYKDFTVTVTDNGIGIPEESIDRIFERFYRIDKTRSRDSGGTGLGLSIVKKAVHMHRGTVTCTSQVNEFTTFEVVIPLKYR